MAGINAESQRVAKQGVENGKMFFTYQELAVRWGCGYTTVRDLARAGHLRKVKIASMPRIPLESVLAYENRGA